MGGSVRQEDQEGRRLVMRIIQGVLVAMVLTVATAASADPRHYWLACRGGGDSRVRIRSGDVSFQQNLGFKVHNPASQGIPAGSCTWLDRGMRDNEPDVVFMDMPVELQMWGDHGHFYVDQNWNPQAWDWITELLSADFYWAFYVYQDGGAFRMDPAQSKRCWTDFFHNPVCDQPVPR
jgi:hypothetical protein